MYFRKLLSLSCLLTSWALRNSCSAGLQPRGCLIVTSAHFCILADKNVHCLLVIILLSLRCPPEISLDSSSSSCSCVEETNELHRQDKPKRHFDHYLISRKVYMKRAFKMCFIPLKLYNKVSFILYDGCLLLNAISELSLLINLYTKRFPLSLRRYVFRPSVHLFGWKVCKCVCKTAREDWLLLNFQYRPCCYKLLIRYNLFSNSV